MRSCSASYSPSLWSARSHSLLRPDRSIAGLFQLSITILTLSIVVASTVGWDWGLLLYLVPVAAVVVLRPKQVPIRSGPVWWWAVLLTFIALLPFVSEAQGHLDRALGGAQNHTTHWSAMAAVTLVLLALGVVVALRITGYRVTGFSIAGAGIGYGAASLAFPFDASSHRTGYALLLIIWGLAWLAALRYADRPLRATSEKQLVPVLRTVGFVFLAFVVSVAWDGNDDQPNVPHRPDPNNPMVVAADVDRETCLGCHATKTAGAPRVPHDPTDTCEGDGCWDGRTDCAGCHRIDPDLPGPVQAVATGPPRPVSFKTPAGESIVPVSPDDLAVLAAIGVER